MGIYYGEQSGKGFKTTLNVSEEELEEYLETWDRDEELLGFSFSNAMTQKMNIMSFGF